ncbi:subtilisin-like protease-like, partial [Trifolium medium]|nr:subtilisin-like protease-like [Trifolium medium]
MIYGDAAKTTTAAHSDEARLCHGLLDDEKKVKGNIVVCDGDINELSSYEIISTVQDLGGLGLVLITDQVGAEAGYYGDFPATV